jgi:hypothetical protein
LLLPEPQLLTPSTEIGGSRFETHSAVASSLVHILVIFLASKLIKGFSASVGILDLPLTIVLESLSASLLALAETSAWVTISEIIFFDVEGAMDIPLISASWEVEDWIRVTISELVFFDVEGATEVPLRSASGEVEDWTRVITGQMAVHLDPYPPYCPLSEYSVLRSYLRSHIT